jgi:molecular chaperone DnaK
VPQIEVTFDIDANGIVHVSAKDLGTGKEQSMTISGGSALPKDDIDRMMRDAQEHADEDKRRREEAETRNLAEQALWQTEKFLAESGEKLPEDSRGQVNEALGGLRAALGGSDTAQIKSAHDTLNQAMQEASTKMYEKAGAGAKAGESGGANFGGPTEEAAGGAGAGSGPEDVVDAEIVDEDDKK